MGYSNDQIEAMRAQLAKAWRQSKSQVMDCEARFYLDLERELVAANIPLEKEGHA